MQVYKANGSMDISECQKVCLRGSDVPVEREVCEGDGAEVARWQDLAHDLTWQHLAGAGHGQEQGPPSPQGLMLPPPPPLSSLKILGATLCVLSPQTSLSCK